MKKNRPVKSQQVVEPTKPRNTRLLVFLLLGAIVLVFGRTVGFNFVLLDDRDLIYENPHVVGAFPGALGAAWAGAYQYLYIPLVYNLWAILAQMSGIAEVDWLGNPLNPGVFHLANLAVHCANALLVFFVLRKLVKRELPAFVGALLFALHPLQCEAVCWATGMKDLLSSAFALAAMLAYLTAAQRPAGLRGWWLIAAGCLLLGGFAKPAIVTVPLMLLVIDAVVLKRGWKVAAAWSLPLLLAVAPASLLTWLFQGTAMKEVVPLHLRPGMVGFSIAHYLQKLVVPWPLTVDYGLRPDLIVAAGDFWIRAGIGAAIVLAMFLIRPVRRCAGTPLGLMLLALLPVLGLVSFIFQNYSTVSDRYMYLALLGPALALAWAAGRMPQKWGWMTAAGLLLVLGGISWVQAGTWADTAALSVHTLEHNPNSYMALNNLAVLDCREARRLGALAEVAAQKGEAAAAESHRRTAAEHWARATEEARAALRYNKELVAAWNNLLISLDAQGRLEELVPVLEHMHAMQQSDPAIAKQLLVNPTQSAFVYLRLNRLPEARRYAEKAVRESPHSETALQILREIEQREKK